MRLTEIVTDTDGAQFTPAGVLRLPVAGLEAPDAMLSHLTERFAS